MTPEDITLTLTCSACPEQYDATHKGVTVGYLRLRWSEFRVDCPDVDGETVYEAEIGDSGFDGCFEDGEQREKHLSAAKDAICKWWNERGEP
jgi:hypothetical protein